MSDLSLGLILNMIDIPLTRSFMMGYSTSINLCNTNIDPVCIDSERTWSPNEFRIINVEEEDFMTCNRKHPIRVEAVEVRQANDSHPAGRVKTAPCVTVRAIDEKKYCSKNEDSVLWVDLAVISPSYPGRLSTQALRFRRSGSQRFSQPSLTHLRM